MRNFKIGSGEAAMRFNGDDTSAAVTWNGTESYSLTAGGLRLRNVATASLPSAPPKGTMVFDTTAGVVKVWDGSEWDIYNPGDALDGSSIALDAGNGIDLSANTGTSATGATTTSELLDHYEEGTWTPNLWDTDSDSSEGQSYVFQSGKFVRIGTAVIISGRLGMSSLGTLATGAVCRIGPLPYTVSGYGAVQFSLTTHNLGVAASITGYLQDGTNYIALYADDTTSGSSGLTVSELSAGGRLYFSGQYITS